MLHRYTFQDITDPHTTAPSVSEVEQDFGASQIQVKNDDEVAPISQDLADEVDGMYRLMDLISESGSNGYGKEPPSKNVSSVSRY